MSIRTIVCWSAMPPPAAAPAQKRSASAEYRVVEHPLDDRFEVTEAAGVAQARYTPCFGLSSTRSTTGSMLLRSCRRSAGALHPTVLGCRAPARRRVRCYCEAAGVAQVRYTPCFGLSSARSTTGSMLLRSCRRSAGALHPVLGCRAPARRQVRGCCEAAGVAQARYTPLFWVVERPLDDRFGVTAKLQA